MHHGGKAGSQRSGESSLHAGSRVAFFGGSFDPPHLGHLAVARAARAAFALDTVLFAPVGKQPLKPEGPAASFEDRLAMTRLAIAGEPGFELSLLDTPRTVAGSEPRPNYSIDTLAGLKSSLGPGCALFCLMGADSFLGLRRWHRAAEIPFVAPLIVASRPGQPSEGLMDALPPGLTLEPSLQRSQTESGVEVRIFALVNAAGERAPFYVLPGLDVEISASEIRKGIRGQIQTAPGSAANGRELVPAAVRGYIAQHNLYRD
jgi:nicotinate-nucleotide adenylyltransferase